MNNYLAVDSQYTDVMDRTEHRPFGIAHLTVVPRNYRGKPSRDRRRTRD